MQKGDHDKAREQEYISIINEDQDLLHQEIARMNEFFATSVQQEEKKDLPVGEQQSREQAKLEDDKQRQDVLVELKDLIRRFNDFRERLKESNVDDSEQLLTMLETQMHQVFELNVKQAESRKEALQLKSFVRDNL